MSEDQDLVESEVGYGRPPKAHQFKKGRSGNPAGRPRKTRQAPAASSSRDIDNLLLDEANRPVTVREGGRAVEMSTIQAMFLALKAAGLKGSRIAQKQFIELTQAAEARAQAEKREMFNKAHDYKTRTNEMFEQCDRDGRPRPEVYPHPDDIILDPSTGEARIVGPIDPDQKRLWDQWRAQSDATTVEIRRLRQKLKRETQNAAQLRAEIERELEMLDLIDRAFPDEETRRAHPLDREAAKRRLIREFQRRF